MPTPTNPLISWTFPEFIKYERGKTWYLMLGIISLAFLIFAILTQNWLFALIIIMINGILILQHSKEPTSIEFTITSKAIHIGDKTISFKDLVNFWIIYEPPHIKSLYFDFKSKLTPRASIPLMNMNPLKVRQILSEYLDENLDKEDEPTSDALAKMMKI